MVSSSCYLLAVWPRCRRHGLEGRRILSVERVAMARSGVLRAPLRYPESLDEVALCLPPSLAPCRLGICVPSPVYRVPDTQLRFCGGNGVAAGGFLSMGHPGNRNTAAARRKDSRESVGKLL